MSFQRRGREDERDEQPRGRSFTKEQADTFTRYCILLQHLVEMTKTGGFNGVVAGSVRCMSCSERCPAGIPVQLVGQTQAICPTCVVNKRACVTIEHQLNEGSFDLTKEQGFELLRNSLLPAPVRAAVTEAMKALAPRAPVKPRPPSRLPETIARLEKQVDAEQHPDEREGLARLLDAARRAAAA